MIIGFGEQELERTTDILVRRVSESGTEVSWKFRDCHSFRVQWSVTCHIIPAKIKDKTTVFTFHHLTPLMEAHCWRHLTFECCTLNWEYHSGHVFGILEAVHFERGLERKIGFCKDQRGLLPFGPYDSTDLTEMIYLSGRVCWPCKILVYFQDLS